MFLFYVSLLWVWLGSIVVCMLTSHTNTHTLHYLLYWMPLRRELLYDYRIHVSISLTATATMLGSYIFVHRWMSGKFVIKDLYLIYRVCNVLEYCYDVPRPLWYP